MTVLPTTTAATSEALSNVQFAVKFAGVWSCREWNSLLSDMREPDTEMSSFRRLLKKLTANATRCN